MKKRQQLGFAVVGCGAIAYSNAEAIRRADSARLAYAVDIDRQAAARLAGKYSVPFSDRLEEAFSASGVDAVIICTPHYLHAPLARRAAKAGKHVLVEKPMGASLEDAGTIVSACREAGVRLGVCYCMRYGEKIEFAKKFIDEGGLGDVIGFEITMLRDRSENYLKRDTWQEGNADWHCVRAKSGGGIFIDNISHYIDYLLYLTGLEIEEVYCRAGAFLVPADVEDNLWAILRTGGGAAGTITVGSTVRGGGREQDGEIANSIQRLWGGEGQAILLPELKVFSRKRIGGLAPNRWHRIKPEKIYNRGGAGVKERARLIRDFSAAVLEGREPEVAGEAGLRVMAVIDAAYRSARSGEVAAVGKNYFRREKPRPDTED